MCVEQHPWPLPARCQEQFPHRDNHRYLQALSLSPVEHKSALVSTPITSYLDHSYSLSVSACFLPVTSSWESSLRNVNLIRCPVRKSCLTLQPHELCSPPGSSSLDSPGKNTGRGCHFLFYKIFLTQGSNPHLLRQPVDSPPLRHLGSQTLLGLESLLDGCKGKHSGSCLPALCFAFLPRFCGLCG